MQVPSKVRIGLGIAGLALATTLASCGGSDNGTPPPVTTVTNMPPASASASVAGFIAYVKTIVASSSDTGAPVDLTGFVAPTDDVGSPDLSI